MSGIRIYVPGDAVAVACGADEIARAVAAAAGRRKRDIEIVRNGSRGMLLARADGRSRDR